MAISGPSSYIPTMDEFIGHWTEVNAALGAGALVLTLPDNTTMTLAQFEALRASLLTQQGVVQGRLTAQEIARSQINSQKAALLAKFHLFTGILDSYFHSTDFYSSRPLAPTVFAGQAAFTEPMVDVMELWEDINAGPAPAGVTLPLVLPDGTTQGSFASLVSALQFAYLDERKQGAKVSVSRSKRNVLQFRAYDAMRLYRDAVPPKCMSFPELIASLPRLTPLPGHTPAPVNASAVFEPPDKSKVVYELSPDPDVAGYELRGVVGNEFVAEDAFLIATNGPGAEPEFLTPFGLTQPGSRVALKVYVVLKSANEAGSATMVVERPLALVA